MICVRYVLYVNNRHRPIHPHFSSLDFGILNTHTPPSSCRRRRCICTPHCALQNIKKLNTQLQYCENGKKIFLYFLVRCVGITFKKCTNGRIQFWTQDIISRRNQRFSQHSFHHLILSKYKFLFSCFFIFHNCGSLK